MALGQAAGVAAHLAVATDAPVRNVNVAKMQRLLLQQGQVLTYFKDLDPADPSFQAMQFWGAKGFFQGYDARPSDPLEYSQAADWLKVALPELKLPPQSDRLLRRSSMLSLITGPESDWADPRNTNRGQNSPVLRGEFCRALYQRASDGWRPPSP